MDAPTILRLLAAGNIAEANAAVRNIHSLETCELVVALAKCDSRSKSADEKALALALSFLQTARSRREHIRAIKFGYSYVPAFEPGRVLPQDDAAQAAPIKKQPRRAFVIADRMDAALTQVAHRVAAAPRDFASRIAELMRNGMSYKDAREAAQGEDA